MARVNPLLEALNAGELSPRMAARVSFGKYQNAADVLRNMIPLPQGGAARRPGTRFVREVKDSGAARLMRFEFNDQQAYVVEMGAGYFRFFTQQGAIVVPLTDGAVTNGTFTGGISGWTDRSTGTAAIAHNGDLQMMNLVGAAASIAWAEQQIAITTTDILHVLTFGVEGAPGDKIQLRIGTTSTGSEIIADRDYAVGTHAVAFTPSADFYIQFRNTAAKTIRIGKVALLDDQPLELNSPYGAGDLFSLRRNQSNDVLYLSRGTLPTYKLLRLGNESWSLVRVAFQDGPYLDQNGDTAKTLQASATTGLGVTITAAGHSPFAETDVGRLVRIQHGANEPGWAVIVGYSSPTVVTADVKRNFSAATASSLWNLGAWSDTTGHPRYLTFFEQRLIGAGERVAPQTFSASQSGDFENFRPDSFEGGAVTVQDDDGFRYTLAAEEANVIQWMAPAKNLLIGTSGGEWVARSDGPVLTPSDIDVKGQTTHGSADVQPVRVSGVVIFLQSAGRKIRNLFFNFNIDSFDAPDLTVLADHVTRSGVVEMAFQEEPDATLWCVRRDGILAALTYRPDQDVIGWGRVFLGGSFDGGHAAVESLAVIPGASANGSQDRDEVWMIVKRTIGGKTKRHVEFLEAAYEGPLRDDYPSAAAWKSDVLSAQQSAFYVDSGLSYDGPPVAALSGLDHLEGETVKIWADGAIHRDRVVVAGQVALNQPAGKVAVGLPYLHRYKSLKLAFGAVAGTAVGKTKRHHAATLVLDSVAEGTVTIGESVEAMEALILREASDAMDSAVPLFTGEHQIDIDGDWDSDPRIILEGDAPAPFTLLAVAPEMKTNDLK